MSTPESDPHTEVLKSIAASLKGIQASLDLLTGAVEGVAESIEKAHEPEGDLGVHLVGALKDLTSALHKRAQQERSHQPQQGQHRQNQPHLGPSRRDDRQQHRQENRDSHDGQEHSRHDESGEPDRETTEPTEERDEASTQDTPAAEQGDQPRKNANRGRGRGRRGGKPPAKQAPKE